MIRIWIAAFLAIMLTSNVTAHPHNVSAGTAAWIEETQSLEVEIKLSVEDLEEILAEQLKDKHLVLDGKSKKANKAVEAYVMSQVAIAGPDKKLVPAKWIGYEVDDATAWLYIEFTIGQTNMKGHVMQNTLLIDPFEEQVNFVNVTRGKKRKTLKFRKRNRTQKLPSW